MKKGLFNKLKFFFGIGIKLLVVAIVAGIIGIFFQGALFVTKPTTLAEVGLIGIVAIVGLITINGWVANKLWKWR